MWLSFHRNPFPTFFKRGLNVTLTTDDPLQFHMSAQPQLEEYITAKHAWGLTMTDLSEIARNSVLISSASHELKEELIGGTDPCDRCNVPKRRFDFRHDERVRNTAVVGLPPPSYPVYGLNRNDNEPTSEQRAKMTDEERKQEATWRHEAKTEAAWRTGKPPPPLLKRQSTTSFLGAMFSTKMFTASLASLRFKRLVKVKVAP